MKTSSVFIQISACQGPLECDIAVTKTLSKMLHELSIYHLDFETIDRTPSPSALGLKSIVLKIIGENALEFANSWQGTIKWQFKSPVRVHHGRKNWFIGVFIDFEESNAFNMNEIRIETMRAQGAGGQHVNKTESAVRVTHIPTGITAISQSERSQHANKKSALENLSYRIKQHEKVMQQQKITQRWHQHYELERGNPIRSFKEN